MYKHPDFFSNRHNSVTDNTISEMLNSVGFKKLDDLIDKTVPKSIRLLENLNLPNAISEQELIEKLNYLGKTNIIAKQYIGKGYSENILPEVIKRNVLENPAWYTAYTPYQAEIAQGRLEALVNFQTMIIDLTGMEIANASLLDEATAAAEAMVMLKNITKNKKANYFFIEENTHPQTIDVIKTRAEYLEINVKIDSIENINFSENYYAAFIQYPDTNGSIVDISNFINKCNEHDIKTIVASDLLALCILTPPGEMNTDVVIGSTQRFGLPLGFGGPHAAFFATKAQYKRNIPGRIIGVSKDKFGKKAYRMALQTREQHIKREKATSNICTAQVLPAVISSFYAVYHGANKLKEIANYIHQSSLLLSKKIESLGLINQNKSFFDTLCFEIKNIEKLKNIAEKKAINFFYQKNKVSISIGETINNNRIEQIIEIFEKYTKVNSKEINDIDEVIPENLKRKSSFLKDKVFNQHHSEHGLLRYIKSLETKDISLVHSMIPLGSCTMKLNAATEMLSLSSEAWNSIHPFAPKNHSLGYKELINELSTWLCEITGFDGISMQPNSGAQGEYAGLLSIKKYLEKNGEENRDIVLIPTSAHGTNPASAIMAGMKVVLIQCDEAGNIDINNLKEKAKKHANDLAALMVTYPSTHGVFEEEIIEICKIVHNFGGQVYMDGANMNAQVGLTSPGIIGADVCHLNLHKTFCIPHGGGGPGMGPIGVKKHLVPFLPGHCLDNNSGAVAASPYSSALILTISYAYIAMMGSNGLKEATKIAILNANYIKKKLEKHYPILFSGKNGTCAHEFIIDCRNFKSSANVQVDDIAKRLMDFNFHAPTVSFPVAGTMMIEPTESETKDELDRFCEAMIIIRSEIEAIEKGIFTKDNNPLVNAPHTAEVCINEEWNYPYSRKQAAFATDWVSQNKFWPSVSRIDNAFGDRNLICTCLPTDAY